MSRRKLTSRQEEYREWLIATGKINRGLEELKRQQAEIAEWNKQKQQAAGRLGSNQVSSCG
jgi:hypothetical protein